MKLNQPEGPADLVLFAKCMAAALGDSADARARSAGQGNDRVTELLRTPNIGARLKDAVTAGSTAGLSAPLSHYQQIVNSFLQWSRCALDVMMPYMPSIRIGFSRIAIWTIGAAGSTATEAAAKSISSIALDADEVPVTKAVRIVVMSEDVWRMESPQGLFAAALRDSLAAETDGMLLSRIVDMSTPTIPASGSDAGAFIADLNAAIAALSIGARSRLFLIVDPLTAAALSLMTDETGGLVFPDLTIQGGNVAGVEVIASGGVARDTSGADLVLVDAAQLAANGGSIIIDSSAHAAVEMESAPVDPPIASTVLTSLWQLNRRAIKAERWFAVARLHDSAVATIQAANYGSEA